MRTFLAFLGLLLAACGGPVEDEPAFPEDWVVEGNAPASLPYLIETARELAPCELIPSGRASITYVPTMFYCGEVRASGCTYLADNHIQVMTGGVELVSVAELVTAHELGHVAWDRCGKVEHLDHPQEFYSWVVQVFDAGRARYRLAQQAQP